MKPAICLVFICFIFSSCYVGKYTPKKLKNDDCVKWVKGGSKPSLMH